MEASTRRARPGGWCGQNRVLRASESVAAADAACRKITHTMKTMSYQHAFVVRCAALASTSSARHSLRRCLQVVTTHGAVHNASAALKDPLEVTQTTGGVLACVSCLVADGRPQRPPMRRSGQAQAALISTPGVLLVSGSAERPRSGSAIRGSTWAGGGEGAAQSTHRRPSQDQSHAARNGGALPQQGVPPILYGIAWALKRATAYVHGALQHLHRARCDETPLTDRALAASGRALRSGRRQRLRRSRACCRTARHSDAVKA